MHSSSGRSVLAYNGELYNAPELRRELERSGVRFRGHSDSEVLLEALEAWGPRGALERFNGMFAFALWERDASRLWLARDRIGIKPLYYGWTRSGDFLFGSELRALERNPGFSRDLDLQALALYLRHGYVPAPHTAFAAARKLPPGCLVCLRPEDVARRSPRIEPWWSLGGDGNRVAARPDEVREELAALVDSAVRMRLLSDVPVGTFLSGGVDSSLVSATAAVDGPLPSFTVGFAEEEVDETAQAARIADSISSPNHNLRVQASEALAIIPTLPAIWDEPFADASQIPTLLVSRLARRHVKVVLSGDGGDELFYGYDRYARILALWQRSRRVPRFLRRSVAAGLDLLGPDAMARLDRVLHPALLRIQRPRVEGQLLARLRELLAQDDAAAFYGWANSQQLPAGGLLRDGDTIAAVFGEGRWSASPTLERYARLDLCTYLPDDILVKVDRASMSVGLEARVPLLDHRIVEWAFRQSPEVHTAGRSKRLLTDLLRARLPDYPADRPKQGFELPLASWLRGPLRELLEDTLAPSRLGTRGLFHHTRVQRLLADHATARRDHRYVLFGLLMLQLWLDQHA
jgi:asparagine synthase (glutamine-hydrolysing)